MASPRIIKTWLDSCSLMDKKSGFLLQESLSTLGCLTFKKSITSRELLAKTRARRRTPTFQKKSTNQRMISMQTRSTLKINTRAFDRFLNIRQRRIQKERQMTLRKRGNSRPLKSSKHIKQTVSRFQIWNSRESCPRWIVIYQRRQAMPALTTITQATVLIRKPNQL